MKTKKTKKRQPSKIVLNGNNKKQTIRPKDSFTQECRKAAYKIGLDLFHL